MSDAEIADSHAQHNTLSDCVPVPDHVEPDLVVDFDYLHPSGMDCGEDVYTAWKRLHGGPDIIWTPRNGGHWIVTRGEDVKFVQENYTIFSHEVFSIPRPASPILMPPLTVDPPLHARYRAVLNPFFTPNRVKGMRDKAAALTRDIATELFLRGRCEFVGDFARVMPVSMFLGIVDLPLDMREQFVDWALAYLNSPIASERNEALAQIIGYLGNVLDERAAKPGEDMLSKIAGWRQNPRFAGEHEVIGMALLVFFGGLDTVANMLSFTTEYLARHPEQLRRLIEQPDIIPQAAEELFRRFGLSNTGRLITRDFDYKRACFRKDEMVMVPISLSSMDDRLYDRPLEIDFDRQALPAAFGHNTFGNGPHKCVGSPLARAELQVFLEEWLKVIPDFRLDPDHPPVSHSGSVNGMNALHLIWDTSHHSAHEDRA